MSRFPAFLTGFTAGFSGVIALAAWAVNRFLESRPA